MRLGPMEAGHEGLLRRYGLGGIDRSGVGAVRYAPGELVLSEGEAMRHLLIVVKGRARVCCQAGDGRRLLYGFYDGDGMLGEVELMLNCPATTTVEAVTELNCLAVSMALAPQLKGSLDFMALAARALAGKLRDSTHMRAAAALYPLRVRLCAYIALMARSGYFEEKWTVLSELMGVSYRHLHRALNGLCQEGLLARRGKGVAIPNLEALEQAGEGCYAPPPYGQSPTPGGPCP